MCVCGSGCVCGGVGGAVSYEIEAWVKGKGRGWGY